MAERHEAVLERLDLADKADTAVRDHSRGTKQKVSLKSALAGDVSVAFLDEPALGLGLVMGGLNVLYKRISNVLNILQFAFIGLISAPVFDLPWARVLPLVQGSAMLQRAMVDGTHLWEFDPLTLAVLVGTSVFYLALGYVVFSLTTRRARRLGVLGDY